MHLAVLAIVAYVGYTQLWPRWRAHQDSRPADDLSESGAPSSRECIEAARSVADDLAREIRQRGLSLESSVDTATCATGAGVAIRLEGRVPRTATGLPARRRANLPVERDTMASCRG